MGASRALTIERLLAEAAASQKESVRLAGPGARLRRASELTRPEANVLPTAVAALDRLLPGGLPKGRLIELSGRRSSGRFSLGLAALAAATSSGEAAALVDLGDHLDPEAAERAGVDLRRLLWARPRRAKEALAAAEMLLAAGFPLVVADLGLSPRTRWVPDAAWVRLARSAAAQGATLLLSTPRRTSGIAAEAVVSAAGARAVWRGSGAAPRLLAGLSSRLTLEKYGRATPGAVGMVSLTAPEAVCRESERPDSPVIPKSPRRGIPSFVVEDSTASAQGLPSSGSLAVARDDPQPYGRNSRPYPNSDHGACPGSFSTIRSRTA